MTLMIMPPPMIKIIPTCPANRTQTDRNALFIVLLQFSICTDIGCGSFYLSYGCVREMCTGD